MGWLGNFFSGVDDLAHNAGSFTDDLAHGDSSGIDDDVRGQRDIIMENPALSSVAMPVVNYFTGGLGSTALQAWYNKSKTGSYGVDFGDLAKGFATNALVNYGAGQLGFGNVPTKSLSDAAYNTAVGVGKGAVSAGIQGNDVSQGALSGGIGAGVAQAGNYAGYAATPISKGANDQQTEVPMSQGANDQQSEVLSGFNPQASGGKTMGDDSSGGSGNPFLNFFNSQLGTNKQGQSTFAGNTGGDIASGLLGIYQGYQQKKKADSMQSSLSNLYAPNSPYAQQMMQTLARQDAASGRRSQGGSRAVQLAAALTNGQAGTMQNQMQLSNMGNTGLSSILQNGIRLGTKPGGLGSAALGGLQSLWNGPTNGSNYNYQQTGATNDNISNPGMENYS